MNEVMTEILTKSLHHDICLTEGKSYYYRTQSVECNHPVVYIGPKAPHCHLVRTGSQSIQTLSHPKGT